MTDTPAGAQRMAHVLATRALEGQRLSVTQNVEWLAALIVTIGIESARAARREALEEAAGIADHGGPDAPWNGRDAAELGNMQFVADRIAEAIRARAQASYLEPPRQAEEGE